MSLFVVISVFSQTNRQKIQTYFESNRAKLHLTLKDVSEWAVESEVPGSGTGITSTYVIQKHQGVEIFNALSNVWIKEGEVINMKSNFKTNLESKVNTNVPTLTVYEAIAAAYVKTGYTKPVSFTIAEIINSNSFKLNDGLSNDVISAKLVYQSTKDNKLKLSWRFQFYSPSSGDLLDLRVDALNGDILESNNLTISCNFGNHDHLTKEKKPVFSFEKCVWKNSESAITSVPGTPGQYRVIPYNYTSPNHSPFQLITTTGNLLANPNGWHNANSLTTTNAALKYTYTRGNNVWAKSDPTGDNEVTLDANVDGGAPLTFNFLDAPQSAQPATYTPASVTNLFYMNNIMHDVWYQYGFNEASGNFQKDNYGRQGFGGAVSTSAGDFVQADAQDGYANATQSLNNANFSTPNDGISPRMQMFLWNSGAPPTNYITINSPASLAGFRVATQNGFGGTDRKALPNYPNGVSLNFALYENIKTLPTYSGHSACQVSTNASSLAGKIVLLRRGGCTFISKVKRAQDAGAAGVIVMDSIVGGTPVQMSSGTTIVGITVPAVFVSKTIGDELQAAVEAGTVNGKIESPLGLYLYADGDFDNTIIAHEYGHGISNKLIGGPADSNCMNNLEQMGEGWSDWFGLMMQLKTGDVGATAISVGTYVENQPNTGAGIRKYPYSTDMTINPLTLNQANNSNNTNIGYRYTIGEFWATVLWDLNWAYIAKYGYNSDIYSGTGGANKVMRLVLDALKLEGCNTSSFVSSRDNIFAAEQATTGGVDYNMIAEVFRRRGLGLNSSTGDPTLTDDSIEDFTPFPSNLSGEQFSLNSAVRVYPTPTNDNLNIRVGGFDGKITIQIADINGRIIFEETENSFNIEKSINIANIQSGIYILNLKANNLNYSQKLIKN